ncbi:acyl-CoA dehydrogenase family protein [Natronomonas salsuginis]|uniref:Acyl-CoA dehydrogenase n=1 Tax=Natronomonas salsuginis TaxID=2217661 RepID=A0A4U5J8K3_9EURY|nr:acyl-CoA dehydrogenase family protein [Natronomonas salsuginis]TKR25034.1 acyl-CoA dehydrogenase [Natronomonas salsuginis]
MSGTSGTGVSFALDDETKLILEGLQDFIKQEVEPLENELGELLTHPRKGYTEEGRPVEPVVEAIDKVRRKSAEAGYYAMNLSEEVGGGGVSNVTWYAATRQAFSNGRGLNEHVVAGAEGPKPLLTLANEEQFETYVKPVIKGEKSTGFGQTEPGVGSDSPNMSTTAEKDGDEWIINGNKQWITNAPYADFIQVFARTTPQSDAGRHGGITCFLVEDDEFELGGYNNAVGQEGLQGEVILDDVRVPESRVLGEVDRAFYDAMEFLSLGRLEIGAQAVGLSEYLLEQAREYATEREAFGSKIGDFQQVSSKIATARARTYAADSVGLRCAWKMDQNMDAIEDTSILKWFATQAYWEVADSTVQIHGGNGVSEENPFMDHLHFARVLRIVEGTDEIQLNTIASQQGL